MAGAGYLVAALWLFPSPLLPNERVVPRVMGLTDLEARRQLEHAGFRVADTTAAHPAAGAGQVSWQDPAPGMAVPRGTVIRIVVSTGAPAVAVPDIHGFDLDMARTLLEAAGLRVEGVDSVEVKTTLPGIAVGSRPNAGDSVAFGRGVIVQLAR